ncbi:MAG: arylsulfatase, partial [Verrucomicrobia bacterium TMED71]
MKFVSLLLALLVVIPCLNGEKLPPNLVVFLSDDMGRAESSVYGSKEVRTPTMDMLAANGMVFDEAYVASPSCCPNRFSLLTGLMPARHGAHPNHSQVKEGTEFLFPLLKAKGYTIASFGKVAHGAREFEGLDFNSKSPRNMSVAVREWFASNEVREPICLLVGDRRPHVPWVEE